MFVDEPELLEKKNNVELTTRIYYCSDEKYLPDLVKICELTSLANYSSSILNILGNKQ
jgi:hypothetical protein